MTKVSTFSEGMIQSLAQVLGECGSGSDITRALADRGFVDDSGESTKWKRINEIFLKYQRETKCPNQLLDFIQAFLSPARFVGRNSEFETHRNALNEILILAGLEYCKDGKFILVTPAATLDEAERRLRAIRDRFRGRALHEEVKKYCKVELMQENYFHAVFEATKGLAQRIRELSDVDCDGANLVDKVFMGEKPMLAINTLMTEIEKSEQRGFAMLLKGCFAAVRNPLAH